MQSWGDWAAVDDKFRTGARPRPELDCPSGVRVACSFHRAAGQQPQQMLPPSRVLLSVPFNSRQQDRVGRRPVVGKEQGGQGAVPRAWSLTPCQCFPQHPATSMLSCPL